MKIIFIFSVLFIVGCAQQPVTPVKETVLSGELKLLQLDKNPNFVKDESGNFQSLNTTELVRIYRHSFASQKELQAYVLNRRMLLHKSFQDEIAPYFGLIQLNRKCLEKVDTKGEMQAAGKDEAYMKMSFPANDSKTLSDCSTEKFWGSVEYHFHNCKKLNEVFEIRTSRKDGLLPARLVPRCL